MTSEPLVFTEDVARFLKQRIKPTSPDAGESVAVVSIRSGVSTRTIYRIIAEPCEYDARMELDMADRLLMASDGHLWECRVERADGHVEYG